MKATASVVLALVAVVGCTSTVQAPDGSTAQYRWVKAELSSTVAAPLPKTEEAARAAFEELNLVGVDGTVDGLKGVLTARMAVGTKVTVKLKALDFASTSIRIRVGRTGDRSISMQLLRHIERQVQAMQ
jgi:hypothetical protein